MKMMMMKPAFWSARHVMSSFMHMSHWVGQSTCCIQSGATFRACFVAEFMTFSWCLLWRADSFVWNFYSLFFSALFISFIMSPTANELLAFVSPMRSANRFHSFTTWHSFPLGHTADLSRHQPSELICCLDIKTYLSAHSSHSSVRVSKWTCTSDEA